MASEIHWKENRIVVRFRKLLQAFLTVYNENILKNKPIPNNSVIDIHWKSRGNRWSTARPYIKRYWEYDVSIKHKCNTNNFTMYILRIWDRIAVSLVSQCNGCSDENSNAFEFKHIKSCVNINCQLSLPYLDYKLQLHYRFTMEKWC